MKYALILNLAILASVLGIAAITANPLALLGLLLLKDLPYCLLVKENDEAEKGRPMGFLASSSD